MTARPGGEEKDSSLKLAMPGESSFAAAKGLLGGGAQLCISPVQGIYS